MTDILLAAGKVVFGLFLLWLLFVDNLPEAEASRENTLLDERRRRRWEALSRLMRQGRRGDDS